MEFVRIFQPTHRKIPLRIDPVLLNYDAQHNDENIDHHYHFTYK